MRSAHNLRRIFLILSVACYAWLGFEFFVGNHRDTPAVTVCLFKNLTGVPCPSCGITRSLLMVIAGDLQGALLMNPLGFFAAAALVVFPLWILADSLAGKNTLALSFVWAEKRIKTKKGIYIPLVALALLNWGWNILKSL